MTRPRRLAVMLGDRYGVGPELVARLTTTLEPEGETSIVVVGDPAVWDAGRRVAEAGALAEAVSFAEAGAGWSFLPRPFALAAEPMGQMVPAAGREVLETMEALSDAAKAGEIDGIVYGPLNKQAMKAAGHAAGDELDFYNTHLTADGLTGEINILGSLWTSRVTSHVPLAKVARPDHPRAHRRGDRSSRRVAQALGRRQPAACPRCAQSSRGRRRRLRHGRDRGPVAGDRGCCRAGSRCQRALPFRHRVPARAQRPVRRHRDDVPRPGADRAEADRPRSRHHPACRASRCPSRHLGTARLTTSPARERPGRMASSPQRGWFFR